MVLVSELLLTSYCLLANKPIPLPKLLCEKQCSLDEACEVGTYVTHGARKGECWLSEVRVTNEHFLFWWRTFSSLAGRHSCDL